VTVDDIAAIAERIEAGLAELETTAKEVRQPHVWHPGDQSDPWQQWDLDMIYMWPPEHHTPEERDKHWRGLQADDDKLAAHVALNDPASVLRDVSQTRSLVAEILSWPHDYNDSDPYYSCTQAVDPHEEGAEPGSGCTNENAGKPCDCGRDTRVHRMLEIIAGRWKLPADLPQNHQRRGRQ
jgi:Family of unknown function (DUF6221)